MSKRGSRSAKFIGGTNWKLSKSRTSSSDPNKVDAASRKARAKELREKRKKERIDNQFEKVCEKFKISSDEIESFTKQKDYFIAIKKNTTRLQAIQRIKSFKIYCKKYNEVFSLENYFDNNYYLIDYKTDYPDVYFFNVYPQKNTQIGS